jgi:nitroimidazol reductase NimA-like FMN-containing flavoprotein (pyridoxamine 5'-phosphate oxidase superfamily)
MEVFLLTQPSSASKQLTSKALEKRIAEFLKQQNMCVLATCKGNLPRATPIEYRSKGLQLYFAAEPGTKIENIKENPNVSVGVFLPYTDWDSVKGAQITAITAIVTKDNPAQFKIALEAYQWEKTAKQFGITEFPERLKLIRVDPIKIEYIDMSLKKEGYSAQQNLAMC